MMGVDEALKAYPLHEPARVTVRMLAINRLKDDPEETPETAVGWALTQATIQCPGCGVFFAPSHTVMAPCDLCGLRICPSCLKVVRYSRGYFRFCPRCTTLLPLPDEPDELASLRQRVLSAAHRGRRNGSAYPIGPEPGGDAR